MRPYEVMVILDAGLDEDLIRGTIDRATKLLSDEGAKVGNVERWGKRRFAYEVHHHSEGYYLLLDTIAEPAAMAALDRMLGLADQVIRHKVIRLPDKVAGRASRSAVGGGAPAAEQPANGA